MEVDGAILDHVFDLLAVDGVVLSDDDSSHDVDLLKPVGWTSAGATATAEVTSVTHKDSKARKRERNREWMRRARQRKRTQQTDVQTTLAVLERKRNELMNAKNLDEAAVQRLVQQQQSARAKIVQYQRINRSYTQVEKTLGELREENFTLREELRRRGVSASIIHDLMQELKLATIPTALSTGDSSEDFRWFSDVDSLFEPLDPIAVADVIQHSYDEISAKFRIAEQYLPNSHTVFGWHDRRCLEGSVASFMFDKAISTKSPYELMNATWKMSTTPLRMRVLQPQTQRMKVLQVLSDNALVVARQNYFPLEDENLCSIYVLFRMPTHDGGFMVATRTIEPYKPGALEQYRRCPRHLFTKLIYTFKFESAVGGGSIVKFGGQVDNIREQHARNCLMDTILAMLRWESHCVAPILTLPSC